MPMIRPLAWIWMGIVIGVSLLATPIKFSAESLTRPVALDVGRATFHALGYLEWALTATLLGLILLGSWRRQPPSQRTLIAASFVGSIVLIQAVWIVPALDERVALIISGSEPPASFLHMIYGAAELAKIATLGLLGAWASPGTATRPSADTYGQRNVHA